MDEVELNIGKKALHMAGVDNPNNSDAEEAGSSGGMLSERGAVAILLNTLDVRGNYIPRELIGIESPKKEKGTSFERK
jgi:hypothetical protein